MPSHSPQADCVVVCIFDGLRPDMVTSALTPNLVRLAGRGTWFREARSVFPSMTRVATASIATGAPPAVHASSATRSSSPRSPAAMCSI